MIRIFELVINRISYVDFASEYVALGIDIEDCIDKRTGKINIADDIQAVIVTKKIIQNIEECKYHVAKQNDIVLIYNGKYWLNVNHNDWSQFTLNASMNMRKDVSLFSTVRFNKLLNQTLMMYLPRFRFLDELSDNKVVKINCNNGTLLINGDGTTELIEHSPNDCFRYCLSYDYLSNDVEIPLFTRYLERILPEIESRLLLQEMFGAILAKDIKLEFIGIFLGEGSNGKSVLHRIMMTIFGEYNVSTLSWSQLLQETSRVDLEGKLLNYSSEIDSGSLSGRADIIKILASKEPIYIRRYYNQSYQMTDYGRILINANRMPPLMEFSHAYLRRLKLISFDQLIEDVDAELDLSNNIIRDEISGILNWVIIGCHRIIKNNRFTCSPKSQLTLKQYIKEQNPVSAFIEELGYEPSMDGQKIKFKSMYHEFIMFCTANKLKFVNSHEFGRHLRQLHFEVKKGAQNKSFVFATKVDFDQNE